MKFELENEMKIKKMGVKQVICVQECNGQLKVNRKK